MAAWLALQWPVIQHFDQRLHDVQQQLAAREHYFEDVLVVDIDERSLRELKPYFGDWPYRRDVYALIRNYLAEVGAKAVVFDILFAESRQGDGEFRQSMQVHGNTVLAASVLSVDPGIDHAGATAISAVSLAVPSGTPAVSWADISLPNAELLSGMNGRAIPGVISIQPDGDGVLRQVPMLHLIKGHYLPSVPVAALFVGGNSPQITYSPTQSVIQFDTRRWPLSENGTVALFYPKNANSVLSMSFVHLAEAALGYPDRQINPELLRGKTIYIGGTAFLSDHINTPRGPMAGTYLLAVIQECLSHGLVLSATHSAWELLLLLIACVPACAAVFRRLQLTLRLELLLTFLCAGLIYLVSTGLLIFRSEQSGLLFYWIVLLVSSGLGVSYQQMWLKRHTRRLAQEKTFADAANEAKSKFLAAMSHEIRTPMNAILGFTDLCLGGPLTEQQRLYLENVRGAGKSLLIIINDVLDISKIEAGKLEIEQVPFAFDELIDGLAATFGMACQAKGLELAVEVENTMPRRLVGDPTRLRQVLTNLLSNALKFTDAGKISLDVRLREAEGDALCLECRVVDSGIGLTEAQIGKLFQAFVQADTSIARHFGGTGLGLSISKKLVEMMNGTISVDSQPGLGSCFAFTVRLRRDPVAGPSSEPVDPAISTWRTLVIAAETERALATQALLKACGGLNCELQSDIEGARAAFNEALAGEQAYDLIVLDVSTQAERILPMVFEIRRACQGAVQPKILLVANYGQKEVTEDVLRLCNALLSRPLTPYSVEKGLRTLGREEPTNFGVMPLEVPLLAGMRVLLVDDNPLNQQLAIELLKRAGIQITVVDNGERAVEANRTTHFDLILMDLQMPIMDGYAATQIIRAGANNAAVPIVALTADVMAGERERCLDAGMNAYLGKPIDFLALYSTLKQWAPSPVVLGQRSKANVAPALPEGQQGGEEESGLDMADLFKRMGGDTALVRVLLETFLIHRPPACEEILGKLRSGDLKEAIRLAHTLKGSAATIGAVRLSKRAFRLEAAIRAGGPIGEVEAIGREVGQAYLDAVAAVERYLAK